MFWGWILRSSVKVSFREEGHSIVTIVKGWRWKRCGNWHSDSGKFVTKIRLGGWEWDCDWEYLKQRGENGKMCKAEDSHTHRDDTFKHQGMFILLVCYHWIVCGILKKREKRSQWKLKLKYSNDVVTGQFFSSEWDKQHKTLWMR